MDLSSPTHLFYPASARPDIVRLSKLGDVGGAVGRAIYDFKKAIHEPISSPIPPHPPF